MLKYICTDIIRGSHLIWLNHKGSAQPLVSIHPSTHTHTHTDLHTHTAHTHSHTHRGHTWAWHPLAATNPITWRPSHTPKANLSQRGPTRLRSTGQKPICQHLVTLFNFILSTPAGGLLQREQHFFLTSQAYTYVHFLFLFITHIFFSVGNNYVMHIYIVLFFCST